MAQSYRDLEVWKKSMAMVTDVYKFSQKFPKEETYGLTSRVRRSAVSVPSNIAEGKGRRTPAEFQHFLIQARGSLYELETQMEISANLGYIQARQIEDIKRKTTELDKMLNSLIDVVRGQK